MAEERATYHHGNLRQTLLDTALALAEERSGFDFTFRELARRAGVTHNAPYRHFAARADLLSALRSSGLERLAQAGRRALSRCGDEPRTRVRALGDSYVRFAEQHPALFRLIMSPPLDVPSADDGGSESYQLLVDTLGAAQLVGAVRSDVSARELALVAWSLVHGLASLLGSGRLPGGEARQSAYSELLALIFFDGAAAKGPPRVRSAAPTRRSGEGPLGES